MKVKLRPACELNNYEKILVESSGLDYSKIYEAKMDLNLCLLKLKTNGSYYKLRYFNIIEETMPTKEQILEAASTSKEAKDALVKLFPQYFKEEKYINLEKDKLNDLHVKVEKDSIGSIPYLFYVNVGGKFMKNKSFCLSNSYNWEILKDEDRNLVLVPTKKL